MPLEDDLWPELGKLKKKKEEVRVEESRWRGEDTGEVEKEECGKKLKIINWAFKKILLIGSSCNYRFVIKLTLLYITRIQLNIARNTRYVISSLLYWIIDIDNLYKNNV